MTESAKKKQLLLSGFNMPCHVCKEPSKSQCPSCETAYCGKACQRLDWKNGHKEQCKELTKEFKRGYNYVEPTTKKKDAPPFVVIPDSVRPIVDMKETTPPKPADVVPSGGESCPICLELLQIDGMRIYNACCGQYICEECSRRCDATSPLCPLCRVPIPKSDAEYLVQLQRRVAKGDKGAQFTLGLAYEDGAYGLKKSMKRAAQLYEISAAQGHAAAQYNLGLLFDNGTGVKLDKKKALKYYRLAADQGIAKAQCNSGIMYYSGEGVERDFGEAQRYLKLAAAQGNQRAQKALASW